ncbi:MAG: T9SS type A sorting domain-containing protein [Bacteroidetes bacterium]|nr:T9SS type A sorting domain-containing protein [Bacteroidota bacterium]
MSSLNNRFFFRRVVLCLCILSEAAGQNCPPGQNFQPGYHCKNFKSHHQPAQFLSKALNSRSDTIDILHYTINLNITDFTNKKIRGNCNIFFKPKMDGITNIRFDLLQLTVDSVIFNGTPLTFSYDDTLITAWFPLPVNSSSQYNISVYYRGTPQMDGGGSGWGGFYFQGGYAFNLGVGFLADPHNYGRVWFPCFDNFVERSTYTCNIITAGGKKAVCGGLLVNEDTLNGDTILRTWQINQTIPTYLASVAVNNYVFVSQSHAGIQGNIPIVLASLPADTTKMKNSFINLKNGLTVFENSYGPCRWDRVGYVLVPFSSGAMEHAMNIAFPIAGANGTLTWETTMAHELSHNWWGNLATCETAEDMWINEGTASYSEFLFTEYVYGQDGYRQEVRNNHSYVIQYVHINEGGYRALYGIPHEFTYGDHVYLKGADVMHTMRGYLGDSLFFAGLRSFFNAFQFTDVNSFKFRDHMTAATGVDMTGFFNGWVFNPGFPHFSVDSVVSTEINPGIFSVTVHMKQRLTSAPAIFADVPIDITFKNNLWSDVTYRRIMNGATDIENFTLGFNPLLVTLDRDEWISDAITSESRVIRNTGNYILHNQSTTALRFTLNLSQITDSMYIVIDHNWTAPDPIDHPTIYRLNSYRYWKVSGIFPPAYSADVQLYYFGQSNLYFESVLFSDSGSTEDSIVLLFRRNAGENWNEFPWYTQNIINPGDQFGRVDLDTLLTGEYVFAMKGDTIWQGNAGLKGNYFLPAIKAYPNPVKETIIFEVQSGNFTVDSIALTLTDIFGQKIFMYRENNKRCTFDLSHLAPGIYFYSIRVNDLSIQTGKIIVQ